MEPAPPIVLASASPRRLELLSTIVATDRIVVRPAAIDEAAQAAGADPPTAITRVARAKAQAAWRPGDTLVAADTGVIHDGSLLGKPRHRDEARSMLAEMRGADIEVITCMVMVGPRGDHHDELVATSLGIGHPDDEAIAEYVATGAADDKAGGLEVQDRARRFIDHVEGCLPNVYGLPLCSVAARLDGRERPVGAPCDLCRPPHK